MPKMRGRRAASAPASANLKRFYRPLGLREAIGNVTIDECGRRERRDDAGSCFTPPAKRRPRFDTGA